MMAQSVEPNALKAPRLIFLDGIRGWAALMVLLSHTLQCLMAKQVILYTSFAWLFISDGRLAVYIFFVLSGFALTYKFIIKPGKYSIAEATVARYFRLAIPVLLTTALIHVFMKAHLFVNLQAAPIINNGWLASFATFEPHFKSMLKFSLFKVFFGFDGQSNYNPILWTMLVEFQGSILCFFIAAIFLPSEKKAPLKFIPIAIIAAYFWKFNPAMACFITGYFLAELYVMYEKVNRAQTNILCALLILPIILLSTYIRPESERYTALMATVIVFAIIFCVPLRKLFSNRLSEYLGKISFPLYLTHIIVILSWSSYLILYMPRSGISHVMASHIILFSTLILAILLATIVLPIERFSIYASRMIANKILSVNFNRKTI